MQGRRGLPVDVASDRRFPAKPSQPGVAFLTAPGPSWVGRTSLKHRDHLDDPLVGQRVPDGLSVAPGLDKAVLAKKREVLGSDALANAQLSASSPTRLPSPMIEQRMSQAHGARQRLQEIAALRRRRRIHRRLLCIEASCVEYLRMFEYMSITFRAPDCRLYRGVTTGQDTVMRKALAAAYCCSPPGRPTWPARPKWSCSHDRATT